MSYSTCELSMLAGTVSSSLVVRKENLAGESSSLQYVKSDVRCKPGRLCVPCVMFFEIQFYLYRVGFCTC